MSKLSSSLASTWSLDSEAIGLLVKHIVYRLSSYSTSCGVQEQTILWNRPVIAFPILRTFKCGNVHIEPPNQATVRQLPLWDQRFKL